MTPIEIDAFLLYHLFDLLYPRFINDQQNILDLVVSDFELDNIVFGLYLYETTKPGIHSAIKELPKESVEIKQEDLDDIQELFKRLQTLILKEYNVKISSIRVIRKRGIDLINSHCEKIKKLTTFEFITNMLDLIQIVFENDLFSIYPEPNVLRFFKKLFAFLNGFQLSKAYFFLNSLLYSFNTLVIINSTSLPIAFKIKKGNKTSYKSNIDINLRLFENEKYIFNNNTQTADFQLIKSDFSVDTIITLNQNLFLQFLTEIFEVDIPPNKEKLKILFQKLLYGIRSYDSNWSMYPKPRFNNLLLRFLIRLLGVNFNLKKLSHWAIPDFIFDLSDTYIGLNADLLLILTDNTNSKQTSPEIFLVRIENSTIKQLDYINNTELNNRVGQQSLESVKVEMSKQFGFISHVIMVDKNLIKTILNMILIDFHKISIFSFLKVIKQLKNPRYFQLYPEIPPFISLKKRSSISFLKGLLSIFIDKHDF